ncbi:fatty acid hydroxylase domain-containing protein 2-like [Cloeon dipterum]|uniref:fatty acid hydroxylase domain-containing protein 2-like n=1 Tax=Cloeon dipterum TaxID=197152 RepID=UPI00321FF5DA
MVTELFSNSLRHCQRFWVASGDFWQSNWVWALDTFGSQDDETTYIYGLTFVTMAIYWGLGFGYILMDLSKWPKFLQKYKIRPGTNEPFDVSKFIRGVLQSLFNQIVVGIPVAYFAYKLMLWRGMPPIRVLPTFQRLLFDLLAFVLTAEFNFYYSHRMLHHKSVYKYFHKKHHEWTYPVSVMAICCHPVEHCFLNMFTVLLGPFLLGSHMATSLAFLVMAMLLILHDHSGFHLPFAYSSQFHIFHHLRINQCFGVIGLLDWLHGTDIIFRRSTAFKRHVVLTGITSTRELYPD